MIVYVIIVALYIKYDIALVFQIFKRCTGLRGFYLDKKVRTILLKLISLCIEMLWRFYSMYNIKYKYCNNFFEISPRAKERSGEDKRRMRGLLETIGVRKVKDSFSKNWHEKTGTSQSTSCS